MHNSQQIVPRFLLAAMTFVSLSPVVRAQGRTEIIINDSGVMPENLRVRELLDRVSQGGVEEVILATNLTAEGEATASYLVSVIKPLKIRVTRIAYGMPVGADLEYTDEITVGRAIKGRREIDGDRP